MNKATYIGGDTTDDDLLLFGDLDGSTEISVIPKIDLTVPADDGGVGIRFCDLREERAVGVSNARR